MPDKRLNIHLHKNFAKYFPIWLPATWIQWRCPVEKGKFRYVIVGMLAPAQPPVKIVTPKCKTHFAIDATPILYFSAKQLWFTVSSELCLKCTELSLGFERTSLALSHKLEFEVPRLWKSCIKKLRSARVHHHGGLWLFLPLVLASSPLVVLLPGVEKRMLLLWAVKWYYKYIHATDEL